MPIKSVPEKWVYSGDLVEAVLQIMEQGPQPMRNMKPSKKNPNGADQFKADHQAEYESHEFQGKDRARQVDAHNAACPKMRDELERRRSTARATAPSVVVGKGSRTARTYFDPNCHLCQKMKKSMEAKKRSSKTKYRQLKRRAERKTRITKPRARPKTKSTFKLMKLRTDKGCQYFYQCTNKGTSPLLNANGTAVEDELTKSELIFFSKSQNHRNSQTGSTNPSVSVENVSDVVSSKPDTSVNSISSYNSNMSLDHEPMVSQ